MSAATSRRILFFIPEDWYLCSHRLPLLRGAAAMGLEVHVATRVERHAEPIRAAGAVLHPIGLRRGFQGPGHEIGGWRELAALYRRVQPHLVHHVTPKSVIYGSLAAKAAGVPAVVNAMAGLGFLYTSRSLKARVLGPPATLALKVLLRRRGSRLIVQNGEDAAFFREGIGVPADAIDLIRGAGVDTTVFRPADAEPPGPLRVAVVGRMLRDKGIEETVAAARLLRARRDDVRVLLVGRVDPENPAGLSEKELRAWTDEGVVEWTGPVDDVAGLLRGCHVALLASYREGLPKSLLEAAACGLPIVATDVTGCREVCLPDVNGLLVPAREVEPIAAALARLADDPALRARFGAASRRLAVEEFAEGIVVEKTMAVYRRLLRERVDA